MLVEARDESGNPMGERQIRDEVMTLIAAAYDTTALAISYGAFYWDSTRKPPRRWPANSAACSAAARHGSRTCPICRTWTT